MQEIEKMWQKVLEKLETIISAITFELWFQPLYVVDFKDKLIICASSATAKKLILTSHIDTLKASIKDVFGEGVDFELLDTEEKDEYLKNNQIQAIEEEKQTKHEDINVFNSKYTFDNFIVGKSNQFCYAAARAVAENPGVKLNPLFIYGGVGLGKTHLMHAIGNYLLQANNKLKIKYVTCENFTNDYIRSLSNKDKGVHEFREKYRGLDVLMIDDIQFISGKDSTQEEFFHTFNDLYQQNKQIVLTSDRPVKELEGIEERIKSRFASGLIQDMQVPDFETRIAILRKKAQIERFLIDEEVINFIAEKVNTNIREMEGLLSKVYFFATLLGKKSATLEEAKEAFTEQEEEKSSTLTPKLIIDKVCDYYGAEYSEVIGKKKSKDIVEPRMIAIYLINEFLDIPLISIGKIFSGRDHTTIMHSRDKITEQIKSSSKTKNIVNELKKQISQNI